MVERRGSRRRFPAALAAAALLAGGPAGAGGPPACPAAIATFPSTDTPLPINALATTISTLTVGGVGPYLDEVEVQTFIAHTWNGDILMTLTSPAGTEVTLTTTAAATTTCSTAPRGTTARATSTRPVR
jgi:hypothetical protein